MRFKYILSAALSVVMIAGCKGVKNADAAFAYDTDVIPFGCYDTDAQNDTLDDGSADIWDEFTDEYEYRLIDTSTGEEVGDCVFKDITPFLNGIAVASDGDDEYYIAKNGERAFDRKFKSAGMFNEGLAWTFDEKGVATVIDTDGKDVFSAEDISNATVFYGGYSVAGTENSSVRVYDKTGKVVYETSGFSAGNVVVDKKLAVYDAEGNMGLVDIETGELTVPEKYSAIGGLDWFDINGYISNLKTGCYIVGTLEGMGVVTADGHKIITDKFDQVEQDGNLFYATLAKMKDESDPDSWYNEASWFNAAGERVLGPYEMSSSFGNGKYAAVSKDGKWGFVDRKGKQVIDFRFDSADSFDAAGLAPVCDASGLYGLIDEKGKFVVNPQFDQISNIFGSDKYLVWQADKVGIIDKTGKVVVEPKFDTVPAGFSHYFPIEVDEASFSTHMVVYNWADDEGFEFEDED